MTEILKPEIVFGPFFGVRRISLTKAPPFGGFPTGGFHGREMSSPP